MKKILLVLKNEIITLVTRPSFWLVALGLPLVGAAIFAGVGAINRNAAASQTVAQVFTSSQDVRPEGYVDLSGLIRQVPVGTPAGKFVAYPDETAARKALQAGEISAFYIVSRDFVRDGKVTYIRPDFNPLASSGDQSGNFTWLLQVNLAGGDALFASCLLYTSPSPRDCS